MSQTLSRPKALTAVLVPQSPIQVFRAGSGGNNTIAGGGTIDRLPIGTPTIDLWGMNVANSVASGDLTVQKSGYYKVAVAVRPPSQSFTYIQSIIQRTSGGVTTTLAQPYGNSTASATVDLWAVTPIPVFLLAGDILKFRAAQVSGGSVGIGISDLSIEYHPIILYPGT